MNTNYIYTTKQVKDAIKSTLKKFGIVVMRAGVTNPEWMPEIYRDKNKNHVRYKVDLKPTKEVLEYLQEQLPFADIRPFTWTGYHPLLIHSNGQFKKEVVVIRVPEARDYVQEVHKKVDAFIEEQNIDWNPDETIHDLVLELSNGAQIAKGADYGELYYRTSEKEDWLPLQDIYGDAPKMANPDEVLKDIEVFGIESWFLD